MQSTQLTINGESRTLEADPRTTLLDALRNHLGLTGSKKGCDHGQCGACTVHVDGQAVRACVLPVSAVGAGQDVTTIEGLSETGDHPVQQAWEQLDTPQCGYCQPGMIMASAALLANNPNPSDADINAGVTNICRCGTFQRVREGIHLAADISGKE